MTFDYKPTSGFYHQKQGGIVDDFAKSRRRSLWRRRKCEQRSWARVGKVHNNSTHMLSQKCDAERTALRLLCNYLTMAQSLSRLEILQSRSRSLPQASKQAAVLSGSVSASCLHALVLLSHAAVLPVFVGAPHSLTSTGQMASFTFMINPANKSILAAFVCWNDHRSEQPSTLCLKACGEPTQRPTEELRD